VTVYGAKVIQDFGKKHADARKPLARFAALASAAHWRHFPELKHTFPAADYASETGTVVFNIGGNKYRLIARVDFDEKILTVETVMTHEDYAKERL
jgi:mRNA interferase HigB